MKRNSKTYYSHRIQLEKMKQKTWLLGYSINPGVPHGEGCP